MEQNSNKKESKVCSYHIGHILGNKSICTISKTGLEIEQLTNGEKHHFWGYIGQCLTIPWNENLGVGIAEKNRRMF